MSDAIIRMLGRPRLTVAGHALSPHAYVLRMFLGEVPTLTVEVASGASTGPDIVANDGLEDVAAYLEQSVGSTAQRVPATLELVSPQGESSVLFRGYAIYCDATLSTEQGRRVFRITCMGLA